MKPDSRFPRLRAVVRTFTSPRRVWFWTTTLPVVLAPVALYLVMRPGVEFDRRLRMAAVEASVSKVDYPDGLRLGGARLEWRGGSVMAGCLVPVAGQPVWPVDPASQRFGPITWRRNSASGFMGMDARSFGLGVHIRH